MSPCFAHDLVILSTLPAQLTGVLTDQGSHNQGSSVVVQAISKYGHVLQEPKLEGEAVAESILQVKFIS